MARLKNSKNEKVESLKKLLAEQLLTEQWQNGDIEGEVPDSLMQLEIDVATPISLHEAARCGQCEAVSHLLKSKAHVDEEDCSKRTPLHLAAAGNR